MGENYCLANHQLGCERQVEGRACPLPVPKGSVNSARLRSTDPYKLPREDLLHGGLPTPTLSPPGKQQYCFYTSGSQAPEGATICPRLAGGRCDSNPSLLVLSAHDPPGPWCPRTPSPRTTTHEEGERPVLLPGFPLITGETGGINYGQGKPKIPLCAPCHYPHLPLNKCVWRFCEVLGCPAPQPPPENRLAISEILF